MKQYLTMHRKKYISLLQHDRPHILACVIFHVVADNYTHNTVYDDTILHMT